MDSSIPSLELPASIVSHHIAAANANSNSGTGTGAGLGLNPPVPVRVASDGIVSTVSGVESSLGRMTGGAAVGGGTRPRRDSRSYKGSPRSGGLRPLRLS